MINILSKIGRELNRAGIRWVVGASVLLSRYDLVERPNDIDIIVSLEDIKMAKQILNSMGRREECGKTAPFTTEHFYEYIIDGIDVDVMAGFGIIHEEGNYRYDFDEFSVGRFINIEGEEIPFASLEDWYILYQVIPNREPKVLMIEEYMLKNGFNKAIIINRLNKFNLPERILNRSKKIL